MSYEGDKNIVQNTHETTFFFTFFSFSVLGQTYRPLQAGRNHIQSMSHQTTSIHQQFRMENGGIVLARHSDDQYNVAQGILQSSLSQRLPLDIKASFPR